MNLQKCRVRYLQSLITMRRFCQYVKFASCKCIEMKLNLCSRGISVLIFLTVHHVIDATLSSSSSINFRCNCGINVTCLTRENRMINQKINENTLIELVNECDHLKSTHHRDVTELQIYGARLGITKNFKEFDRVKIFKIRHGHLSHVKTTSIFEGLNAMEILRLTDNEIEKMEKFPVLQRLQNVNLSNNRMRMIHEDLFAHLATLKHLTLECNEIFWIHPNSFVSNRYLEEINLNRNKLASLDPEIFQRNPLLMEISLNHNNFDHVNKELFKNVHGLQVLLLKDNRIRNVQKNLFPKHIKWVDMSGNAVSYVHTSAFSDLCNLEYFDLQGNVCLDSAFPLELRSHEHLKNNTRGVCHYFANLWRFGFEGN